MVEIQDACRCRRTGTDDHIAELILTGTHDVDMCHSRDYDKDQTISKYALCRISNRITIYHTYQIAM